MPVRLARALARGRGQPLGGYAAAGALGGVDGLMCAADSCAPLGQTPWNHERRPQGDRRTQAYENLNNRDRNAAGSGYISEPGAIAPAWRAGSPLRDRDREQTASNEAPTADAANENGRDQKQTASNEAPAPAKKKPKTSAPTGGIPQSTQLDEEG